MNITAMQCRKARQLLKWNHRDLAHNANVRASRIVSFERGIIHLHPPEMKEIHKCLKAEGIVFGEFGDVILDLEKFQEAQGSRGTVHEAVASSHDSSQEITVDEKAMQEWMTPAEEQERKRREEEEKARREQEMKEKKGKSG